MFVIIFFLYYINYGEKDVTFVRVVWHDPVGVLTDDFLDKLSKFADLNSFSQLKVLYLIRKHI